MDDVATGKPAGSTLLENAPLTLLCLGLVALGGWLVRSGWAADYTETVARFSVANAVGVALLMALIVSIQREIQGDLKPLVIAADAVVIGTLGGVGMGVRTAQQERATAEAESQRDRFRALFENVPNPIVGVEREGEEPIVRTVNPAFTEVFGFDSQTIVGESLAEYVVPPDESLDPVGQPATVEDVDATWDRNVIDLETVDGQRKFVRLTAPVERGPSRDRYAIYIDVTVQRQRHERLQALSRTLRHDIRNQLTVIQPSARAIAAQVDGEPAAHADRIEDAADNLLEISERARDLERQIAGESDPRPRNLARVVEETVATLREQYDCAFAVDVPETVYGTTTPAFSLAVEAVVRNAVEHNDSETPTVEVSVVESLDGNYYDVRVADDGPGIPQSQVEVVSGDSAPSQTQHLSGLGLWTARWVMQNSGGELEFDANSPEGAIVTLRIPQATPPETVAAEQ
ncbi:MAG: ATP-binding protein [Halosimplex sp.]